MIFLGNGSRVLSASQEISQPCRLRQMHLRSSSFKVLVWQAIMNLSPEYFPPKDKTVILSYFPEAQILYRVLPTSFNHFSSDKVSSFITGFQLLLSMH